MYSFFSNSLLVTITLLSIGVAIGFTTAYVSIYDLLRKQAEKRLETLEDQFVSLSSHYLLTPVSTIQAAVGRLQEAESMGLAERRKMYDAIYQADSRLWIIAQQLILMNQFGTDRLKLDFGAVNLDSLVVDSIRTLEPLIRKAKVKVLYDDSGLGSSQVSADGRRLKQAFIAILDNAVKFSPEGGEVKVRLGSANQLYQLVTSDSGAGMPFEVQKHISEKFYRGTDLYRFDYEGMGLGMYIAERIVALHQGAIKIESAPKSGTRVTIEFPKP